MKLVVVTGASRGVGLAICERLLKDEYKVVAINRSETDEFSNLKENYNKQLFYKMYDFKDTKNIQTLVKEITKQYGKIYGLVNNAALGTDGVLGTMHDNHISELIKVNIEAPIILTKYVSRSMLMKMEGRIINISSIIATTGFNGLSVYGATKASLSGFTKSLARELGKANITVNNIAPGYMQTAMTSGLDECKLDSIKRRSPLGDLVSVNDVAASVSFLLSDDAKNITGTTITVDAGSTA